MDQSVDIGLGEDRHENLITDDLEIEFDLDGTATGTQPIPDENLYGNNGPGTSHAANFAFDKARMNDGEAATVNEEGLGNTGDDAHVVAKGSSSLQPGGVVVRAESEIGFEDEDEVREENAKQVIQPEAAGTEETRNSHTAGTELDEDEITFDDGDEGAVGGASLGQGSHDHAPPHDVVTQQVLGDDADHSGMAFDFEGDTNESTADDIPHAAPTASSEDSEMHESVAEELGFGSVEDLRPDANEPEYEEGYESSSEDNGANVQRRTAGSGQATHQMGSKFDAGGGSRPSVLVHYNGVDYDLFARSHDASPDTYFLSDLAPLDYSLTQFLACLRDLLSEDVTDAEKLVFRVDSLGLEFGEMTSKDFLDRKSFRMILSLHQGLMKNDNRAASDPLHTHLLSHTECAARFEQLVEGVRKGLGLSAFISSTGQVGNEYGISTTTSNHVQGGEAAATNMEDQYETSESYSEEDSAEGDAAAEYGQGAKMSGAIRSNAEETENGNDEDEEQESEYADDNDEVAEDDFGDHLDDGGGQDQMTYNDGGFGTNDLAEGTLHEDQPSVGAFVDEPVPQSTLDNENQQIIGDDMIQYEGVEEFVDYDEAGLERSATDEVAHINGNLALSATSLPPPTPAADIPEDEDLIDYSDDEELPVTGKVLPGPRGDPYSSSSPCQRKTGRTAPAMDEDLIDYSDDEIQSTLQATLQRAGARATSVASHWLQGAKSSKPVDEFCEAKNGGITDLPALAGRSSRLASFNLPDSAVMAAGGGLHPTSGPPSSTRASVSVSLGNEHSRGPEKSRKPRKACTAVEHVPYTRVRMIKAAAYVTQVSTESTSSNMSIGSGFSSHFSYQGDADFSEHEGATVQNFDDIEHHDDAAISYPRQDEQVHGESSKSHLADIPQLLNPDDHAEVTHETGSQPTSATSTLHGDDRHVDSNVLGEEDPTNGNPQTSDFAVAQNSLDEIDWEDHVVDEENFTADATVSSIPGKRDRPEDDFEGLVDETEAKRRRT